MVSYMIYHLISLVLEVINVVANDKNCLSERILDQALEPYLCSVDACSCILPHCELIRVRI